MNNIVFSVDIVFSIKAATRDLVERAGGMERAGRISGRGKSSVERWCNVNEPDVIPVHCAVLLERDTGTVAVTEVMASLAGRSVMARTGEAPAQNVMTAAAHAAQESAEVMAEVSAAMADGVISPNEKARIVKECSHAAEAYRDLGNYVAGSGGDALRVVR